MLKKTFNETIVY